MKYWSLMIILFMVGCTKGKSDNDSHVNTNNINVESEKEENENEIQKSKDLLIETLTYTDYSTNIIGSWSLIGVSYPDNREYIQHNDLYPALMMIQEMIIFPLDKGERAAYFGTYQGTQNMESGNWGIISNDLYFIYTPASLDTDVFTNYSVSNDVLEMISEYGVYLQFMRID